MTGLLTIVAVLLLMAAYVAIDERAEHRRKIRDAAKFRREAHRLLHAWGKARDDQTLAVVGLDDWAAWDREVSG